MNVATSHVVKQLAHILWQWLLLSLAEVDTLGLQRAGPVHVNLQQWVVI